MEKALEQDPINIIKVVLFGPESSGKTTLSKHLARHYNTVWTPEFAREYLISQLGITDSIKSHFRKSPHEIEIFLEGRTISANLNNGKVEIETISNRSGFKESNFLHLNKPKAWWTWVADLFAVALILLAITGLFMIKGKKGFSGRGKWLFLLGIVIPIVFLFIYY